jgi:hypothetical protein
LTQHHLSPTEKSKVRSFYKMAIEHDVITDLSINGGAIVGMRKFWINFKNLMDSYNEFAQMVLHQGIRIPSSMKALMLKLRTYSYSP